MTYTLEHLIETFQITVMPVDALISGKEKYAPWIAKSITPRVEQAEGKTVREAVENLVEKLTQ